MRPSDGTATAGSDYTAASGTLTFTTTSWDTAQTVNVAITNDSVDDDDETFTFTLSDAGTGAALSASASVTTTITDDDDPEVTVSFGAGSYSVAEGSTISVTVRLSAAPKRSVTISLTTENRDGATPGDYSGVPASVTFKSSEDLKTVVFASTPDAVDESDETVTLGFVTPLPAGVMAVAGTTAQAVVTITDDDTVLLSVSGPTSATVAEDAGTATYTRVAERRSPVRTWTVDYATADYATADGTATAGPGLHVSRAGHAHLHAGQLGYAADGGGEYHGRCGGRVGRGLHSSP